MMDLIYNQVWPLPRQLILASLQMTENLVDLGFPLPLALSSADIVADFAADARIRLDRIAQHTDARDGFTAALGAGGEPDARRESFDAHFSGEPAKWRSDNLDIILDGIQVQLERAGRRR
jgi:hypothetical protein